MTKPIAPIRLIVTGTLLWSIGLIWLLVTFPKDTFETTQRTLLTGATNDSIIPLGSHPEICRVLDQVWGSIEGETEGTIQTLKGYQNLFQTDDGNLGIRLEVSQSGVAALVVSSPPETSFEKFVYVVASGLIEEGKKFHLYFRVSFDGGLTLKLDSQPAQTVYSNINPTCQNVQLGVGYDISRKTIGTTKTTITEVGRAGLSSFRGSEIAIILLFVIGLTLIFWALTKDDFLRPSRGNEKS